MNKKRDPNQKNQGGAYPPRPRKKRAALLAASSRKLRPPKSLASILFVKERGGYVATGPANEKSVTQKRLEQRARNEKLRGPEMKPEAKPYKPTVGITTHAIYLARKARQRAVGEIQERLNRK